MLAAALAPSRTVTISEVARVFGIAESHMRKIVHELARAGFLRSRRGRRGGFGLGRSASEIRVAEVLRATEADFALVECQRASGSCCPLMGRCRLERLLERARAAFFAELERVTLADLVPAPSSFLRDLGLEPQKRAPSLGAAAGLRS